MSTHLMRTILVYILILIAFRLMGKRQISQLQTSELAATIILSELAVIPIQNQDQPLLHGIIPMLVLVAMEILVSYLMIKSNAFRKLICGKPIVLIEKGKIQQQNLRKVKLSVEDLWEQLRQKEAFFLDEIDYAIIESAGSLSVIKKAENNTVTVQDMSLKPKYKGVELVVVSDGKISQSSLTLSGKSEEWVQDRVSRAGFAMKDVFIMTLDSTGKYRIIPREL